MSKSLKFSLFTVVFSLVAHATPSWVAVNTEEYAAKDTSPSAANASRYSAYYCTKEAARAMFDDNDTVNAVTAYIAGHFAESQESLGNAETATALLQSYRDTFGGQYVFKDNFLSGTALGDYLAVVLYENGDDQAVRVLGNAEWTGDSVAFDSQAGGSVGGWTAAAIVPEPTSGLMLLLGLAGLALKRNWSGTFSS